MRMPPAASIGIVSFGILFATQSSMAADGRPPGDCKDDLQCYINFSGYIVQKIGMDINWWSNLYTIIIFLTIIFGVITTLMIALQDDTNKKWTKPTGLISTTLGAAMATIINAFHIPDNIDKLLEVRSQVGVLINDLEHDYKSAPDIKRDDLFYNYSKSFAKLMDDLSKLKGSTGHMNVGDIKVDFPPKN